MDAPLLALLAAGVLLIAAAPALVALGLWLGAAQACVFGTSAVLCAMWLVKSDSTRGHGDDPGPGGGGGGDPSPPPRRPQDGGRLDWEQFDRLRTEWDRDREPLAV